MSRIAFAALAALAVAGPVRGQTADSFDIVCAITRTTQAIDAEGKPSGRPQVDQLTVRYSLDVAGDRWCEETNCRKGHSTAFNDRGPDILMLDDVRDGGGTAFARFTRSSSRFELSFHPDPSFMRVHVDGAGPCRLEPFTGPRSPAV